MLRNVNTEQQALEFPAVEGQTTVSSACVGLGGL